jgi:hypothetical protein
MNMDSLWKSCLSACVAYGSHYCMTKIYSEICVPDTFYGFLQGEVQFVEHFFPSCQELK